MSSVPDNYEINVAKDGKHYCRIQLSEQFEEKAKEKLDFLREIFGNEFELKMIHWICRGERSEKW